MARQRLIQWVAFAIGISCLGITPLRAHGEYDWIREGNYTGKDDVHCCGAHDCFEVQPSTVRLTSTGWAVSLGDATLYFKDGEKGVHKSEDGRFWMCVKPDGDWRCFFAPPLGV